MILRGRLPLHGRLKFTARRVVIPVPRVAASLSNFSYVRFENTNRNVTFTKDYGGFIDIEFSGYGSIYSEDTVNTTIAYFTKPVTMSRLDPFGQWQDTIGLMFTEYLDGATWKVQSYVQQNGSVVQVNPNGLSNTWRCRVSGSRLVNVNGIRIFT